MKKPKYMRKLYLDMDGVLCDFDKRFRELFGHPPEEVKGTFTKSSHWKEFVEGEHFATLDWFPGAKDLLEYIHGFDIQVEILSSSGGEEFYTEIADQKTRWLRSNNLHYPVNIVPGKRYKRDFAHPQHVLVDDTDRNIVEFIEAGGFAILHLKPEDTISVLEYIL